MQKSLGQVAYEAFDAAYPGGIPWKDLGSHAQAAWESVGQAVAVERFESSRPDRVYYRHAEVTVDALMIADEIIKPAKETP
jgi:hypothetical protein